MSESVRRVVIETEIRSADGRRGGGGKHNLGIGGSGGGGGSGDKTVWPSTGEVVSKSVFNNRIRLMDKFHRDRLKNIRAENQMLQQQRKMEEQSYKQKIANEKWLTRVKQNSLRMERDRTREIIRQAKAQDSYMSSPRAQRIRQYAENQINYRTGMGQPAHIGGLRSKTGHTRNPMGHGGSFFTTGIPSLDRANQIGFQAFITMMTARMAGQLMKGIADNLGGIGGEGDSFTAQIMRQINLSGSYRTDDIFQWGKSVGGGFLRGIGVSDQTAEKWGYGRIAQSMIEGPMGAYKNYEQMKMLRYETSGMKKEDDLIIQKRELLQQEMASIEKRIQADNAFAQSILGTQVSQKRAYGMMGASDRKKVDQIGQLLAGGVPISQWSREQQQFLATGPAAGIFPNARDNIAENLATAAGYDQRIGDLNIGGTTKNDQLKNAFRQLRNTRQAGDITRGELQVALDMPLNIDRINLELDNMQEKVWDAIQNPLSKALSELKAAIIDELERAETNQKVGGGPSKKIPFGDNPGFNFNPGAL